MAAKSDSSELPRVSGIAPSSNWRRASGPTFPCQELRSGCPTLLAPGERAGIGPLQGQPLDRNLVHRPHALGEMGGRVEMGSVMFLGGEDARVVSVALDVAQFPRLERRLLAAFPVGRMAVQVVGEIDDRAMNIGIGHRSFVLRDQQQRQRQTTAYRKCLPVQHPLHAGRSTSLTDAPRVLDASVNRM